MFNSSSERQSFQKRVASHSTKPRANGRVDVLPPNVAAEEEIYLALKEQTEIIQRQLVAVNAEIEVTQKLLSGHIDNRHEVLARKRLLFDRRQALQTEFGRLRETARDAGERSYTQLFYHLASARIAKQVFIELDEECRAMMGRTRHEIKAPKSVLQKQSWAARKRLGLS